MFKLDQYTPKLSALMKAKGGVVGTKLRPHLDKLSQIREEFRRITTISLEQSFMFKLDQYTPKLSALMKAKGGVVGTKLRPHLDKLSQIREEFRRITTISLEQSFMFKLDQYTPKLSALMKAKGGVVGTKLRPHLDKLSQNPTTDVRRDAIIRGLMLYLGEKEERLFEDCMEDNRSDATQHLLKILVVHGTDREEPVNVSILLEGKEALAGCRSTATACALLMGLIYALNLAYPHALRYTFEVFQKLFLDLDGMKLSPKVHALKLKLIS